MATFWFLQVTTIKNEIKFIENANEKYKNKSIINGVYVKTFIYKILANKTVLKAIIKL